MSVDQWRDDEDLARRVVREGLKVLGDSGVVMERIGNFSVLSSAELKELMNFRDRIHAYLELKEPKHPLCLGVFGPPGSGKSFAVEELLKTKAYVFRTLNLSQMRGSDDLSSALAEVTRWLDGRNLLVFFDEFDSSLAGVPLGWLQWLLAPMQDGIVVDRGNLVELKRAVFVFAGGTADTFEEFPDVHEDYFRRVKGPDFLSRLRGHMNVRGPNAWPYRRVRRAICLRLAVERVAPGLLYRGSIPEVRMDDAFIDKLLAVGRYRHGSRSVEALVEMSTVPTQQHFSEENLPSPNVRASHVDLGPLADLVLALSAGGTRDDYDEQLQQVWPTVATRLLEFGVGLVYGGDLHSGGFTEMLLQAEQRLPNLLGSDQDPGAGSLARPRSGRVTWVRAGTRPQSHEASPPPRVDVRLLPSLSEDEYRGLGLPPGTDLSHFDSSAPPVENWRAAPDWCKRLGNALALFRMRALIARFSDAQLVFGGRAFGGSGRFPGIAEEVMLSLAAGNAVYVCGGFGGAAEAVGQVLGLGKPWGTVPRGLQRDAHGESAAFLEAMIQEWGMHFQLPHRDDLPLDYHSLVSFLRSHAIDGPRWPDNGLTAEENRALFRSSKGDEIVRLVSKGMCRRLGGAR
jgi:hypothetical protein